MKKVGLIGTSPIMLILANHLAKKGKDVTIFENSKKIGGAWTYYKFNGHYIGTQTNVIVPGNLNEEKKIPILNNYLNKNLSVKIFPNNKRFEPLGYLAKKNYDYELNYLYNKILKNKKIKIKKTFIKNIKSTKTGAVLDQNEKFDKIYLPTFAGIKKISTLKKNYKVEPKLIVSEHLLMIAKRLQIDNSLSYSENFDKNFDRIQTKSYGKYKIFTARIRKEKKGKNIINLIKDSKLLFSRKDLIKIVKTKYKNYYRNEIERDKLKKICKNTNIVYINSSALTESFFSLNNKIKLIS